MKCVLVFNNLNDIIYAKYDRSFCSHIKKLAVINGLLNQTESNANEGHHIGTDIIMQLFSPLITSQRVMLNHFSNPYSNIKCYEGLNIVFDEYVGYIFVSMGCDEIYNLKRYLRVFISIIKHTCGPDLTTLKSNENRKELISRLLDVWSYRILTEQSQLVEALEHIRVNTQTASHCLNALTEAAEKVKTTLSVSQVHAFIAVNHRFLSLYSTRSAIELQFSDINFLFLLGEAIEDPTNRVSHPLISSVHRGSDSEQSDESTENVKQPKSTKINFMRDFVISLGKQRPHVVHIHHIARSIPLFLIYELGNDHLNGALLETLHSLCTLQDLHARGTADREVIHSSVDVTDNSIKKLCDLLKKKSISSSVDKTSQNTFKTAIKKWDVLKKKYQDYLKSHNVEFLQKIDSGVDSIISLYRSIYSDFIMIDSVAQLNRKVVLPILENVEKVIRGVVGSFEKLNSAGQSKSSLSINKYLEEFPGLVHFIYIDRVSHRFMAPNLDFSSKETTNLTRNKIWNMVKFAWSHLQEGHTALMWKDTVFNYSYFLWFEDISGTPLKPKVSPLAIMKNLPPPGVLNADFYQMLMKKCFPAMTANRIRCYELFSVHLSLVTSSSVLEQSRRLTATIWEVTGTPTNPLDLL